MHCTPPKKKVAFQHAAFSHVLSHTLSLTVAAANERKSAAQNVKNAKKAQEVEAAESADWSKGSKGNKKEAEEQKRVRPIIFFKTSSVFRFLVPLADIIYSYGFPTKIARAAGQEA